MPKSYSPSLRRQVCTRLRSGEPVAELSSETGISLATLFGWKAQALIDGGVRDGVPSTDADEPTAAHKRIAQLEAELALARDACALFDEGVVISPKGKSRSPKDRSHSAIRVGRRAR
ncbi:transposase [Nocardia sp. NPDC059239]|uniref:transposase n=1 Tax=Nocardia sp. NPDC059239 TaxID=3346785 RepID=UPI0036B86DC2